MNLKDNAKKGFQEAKDSGQHLDMDTFGFLMDEFIRKSACGLTIFKHENEEEFSYKGSDCGGVVDFFILLNAIPQMVKRIQEDFSGGKIDLEPLADSIAQLVKKYILKAGED